MKLKTAITAITCSVCLMMVPFQSYANESGWIYGTYECHDGYMDAALDVGWYSDPEADYISLNGATVDGSSCAEFTGVIISDTDGQYVAMNEYGQTVSFVYDENSMITITECSPNLGGMYFYGFQGTYCKTQDLSHDVS